MIRVPWIAGPRADWSGPVVVSLTDFAVFRARDLPRVWRTGMRLRRSWPQMQGAVGLWLWSLPLQQRGGSISVWLSEDDLQRFVRWPVHLAIMRENRDTGRLRAATWHAERFVAADTWAEANVRLMSNH